MRGEMKTSALCIPKFKGSSSSSSNHSSNNNSTQWLSPVSLLERFREAVFRLIMLTALSKTNRDHNHHQEKPPRPPQPRPCYSSPDQHQSDAVADCIEFIKKSASPRENRDSFGSSSSTDADDEGVVSPDLSVL